MGRAIDQVLFGECELDLLEVLFDGDDDYTPVASMDDFRAWVESEMEQYEYDNESVEEIESWSFTVPFVSMFLDEQEVLYSFKMAA